MLNVIRYHSRKKIPVLLLVLSLCVQSLGFAGHGISVEASEQTQVAEQSMAPCHDMPETQVVLPQAAASDPAMPCCDAGHCADAQCMMPPGTHFVFAAQDYFIAHNNDIFILETHRILSPKASPPIRPPIA
jgi:hypothetical protein